MNESGFELDGLERRFHSLQSLNLDSWLDADWRHLDSIIESCRSYFRVNPYDRWFRKLDEVLSGVEVSFYAPLEGACHLDLIPYATSRKWAELPARERRALILVAGDTLGLLLRDARVRVLVLNGRSVVDHFEKLANVRLDKKEMASWTLPRRSGPGVPGIAFQGEVDTFGSVQLERRILVLGYNHNLQSSFGVTAEVLCGVRAWIRRAAARVLW